MTERLQSYHLAWLSAHPSRSAEWLLDRLADGFHVHHVDGDHSNDDPRNLALMEGADHMRLHGINMTLSMAEMGRKGGKASAAVKKRLPLKRTRVARARIGANARWQAHRLARAAENA